MAVQREKMSPPIDLDTLLVEEIGQFGRYQIFMLLLALLPSIFAAISSTEYVFTTGRLPTRCLIPECDVANPEFEPEWLGSAVPGNPGNYDECNRFVNISDTVVEPFPPNTCPAELFNREQIFSCDQYVHERTDTVVYDFGLECDEWRRTLIGSIRTFGMLLSLPITGFISDRWGRRIALSINAVNMAWMGMLRAFAPSYEWYIVLQTLEATFGGGTYSTCFILVTEFVGPKYRVVAGPIIATFFALGGVILGLLAWAVQDWRNLTLSIFIPQIISVGLFWVLPESVRWLMSKGKYIEAEKILTRAAKVNNKKLSEKTREVLLTSTVNETVHEITEEKQPSLLIQVWRSRVILSRCCVTPIWWIVTIMVYYGVSINAVSLAGNIYLNYIYVCAIEIPGYWTAMLILDRIGRKITLIMGYLVCSACQYCFAFITNGHDAMMLILYLLGKYSISVVVTSMYVYTAELYPTKCRHSLFAFSSMIGRFGSIVAPLTPALIVYWEGIPSVLFGSLTLLAAVLVLTTPETLGTKLPDTIEEAEVLQKSEKIRN